MEVPKMQLQLNNTAPHLGERFWDKVAIGDVDACWLWSACRNRQGYGLFWLNGKMHLAHRLVVCLRTGDPGVAMHACDTPACCNPAHIAIGTQADNMADRDAKGRNNQPKGEANGEAKLTEVEVIEIRERYAAGGIYQKQLAAEYGVDRSRISYIVLRKNWAHL